MAFLDGVFGTATRADGAGVLLAFGAGVELVWGNGSTDRNGGWLADPGEGEGATELRRRS